jgi:hypothetical protein
MNSNNWADSIAQLSAILDDVNYRHLIVDYAKHGVFDDLKIILLPVVDKAIVSTSLMNGWELDTTRLKELQRNGVELKIERSSLPHAYTYRPRIEMIFPLRTLNNLSPQYFTFFSFDVNDFGRVFRRNPDRLFNSVPVDSAKILRLMKAIFDYLKLSYTRGRGLTVLLKPPPASLYACEVPH